MINPAVAIPGPPLEDERRPATDASDASVAFLLVATVCARERVLPAADAGKSVAPELDEGAREPSFQKVEHPPAAPEPCKPDEAQSEAQSSAAEPLLEAWAELVPQPILAPMELRAAVLPELKALLAPREA